MSITACIQLYFGELKTCLTVKYNPLNKGALPYKHSGSSKFLICCLAWLMNVSHAKCTPLCARCHFEKTKKYLHFLLVFIYIWVFVHFTYKRSLFKVVENYTSYILRTQFVFVGLMVKEILNFKRSKVFMGSLQ